MDRSSVLRSAVAIPAEAVPAPEPIIHLELVDAAALAGRVVAWADLCDRALERNVFLDPAFALPLFQHAPPAGGVRYLLVWEESGPASFGRLLGLFPLVRSRTRTARVCLHEQTSCGTPLVDRDQADRVLEAVFAWLGERPFDALAIREVVQAGPFHSALGRCCAASSRGLVTLEARSRAVLHRFEDDNGRVTSFASARRRQQQARQARRLARNGLRTYTQARSPDEVAGAMERFLLLEQAGWKGRSGTALLADPRLATFARTMTRQMAQDGRCRIDAVELDGRPVALGLIITDRGRAHFWKIAFDEAYALFSPGVQLALELTRAQLADPEVAMTDSCAPADHSMIDRIWPDRITMVDLFLAVGPGSSRRFDLSLRIERWRRALRRRAKALWGEVHRRRDAWREARAFRPTIEKRTAPSDL